jgi:Dockerin type I domain/PKD domain
LHRHSTTDENGIVTLSGMITEPDVGDLFTLVVDWGDGNSPEEFHFDPAQGLEVKVQHQYRDDPSGSTSDDRVVSLLWRDQHGASNIGDLITTVLNVAPSVRVRPENVMNGSVLQAQGDFTDPGTDSWFATVDYGNGQGEKALPLSPNREFNFTNQYSEAGLYTVKVKVTDDDGGVGESTFPVRVELDNDGQLYLLSWRNRRLNVDVNDDGEVAPLDVLLIINELSRRQGSDDLLPRIGEIDLFKPMYVDTSGDSFLAPIDVLLVINFLSRQSRESVAEGEATPLIDSTLGFERESWEERKHVSIGSDSFALNSIAESPLVDYNSNSPSSTDDCVDELDEIVRVLAGEARDQDLDLDDLVEELVRTQLKYSL